MRADGSKRRAVQMLILASLCWGLSFPVAKALGIAQQQLAPEASSWFLSSLLVLVRFGLAAVVLFFVCFSTLKRLTWLEVRQGAGLGLFGGVGLLFQVDGLAYTSASTSAFLTQCHCLFVPVLAALLARRWPGVPMVIASVLVLAGVAILAGLDWTAFKLGRGEAQTLIGALFFSGQILLLDRPVYAANRAGNITWVMFATMALIGLPLTLLHASGPAEVLRVYSSPAILGLMALLVVVCTLLAFGLMNRWQPRIPAGEAALIYAAEPVFATAFALFLPGLLAALAGLNYPNETFTLALLAGGGLICAANFFIQSVPAGGSPLRAPGGIRSGRVDRTGSGPLRVPRA